MAVRIAQLRTETLRQGIPNERVTQIAIEVISKPSSANPQKMRVTQIAIEFPFTGITPPTPPPPPVFATENVLVFVPFGGNGRYPGFLAGHGNVYTTPQNPDSSPVLLTDQDYGQIDPYYTTYFFVNHEQEQALKLGSHRKLLTYLTALVSGTGNLTITCLVNVLSNPWPLSVTRTLDALAEVDLEWSGGSVTADRMAFKFASSPPTGTDNTFLLEKATPTLRPARHLPVRGSAG